MQDRIIIQTQLEFYRKGGAGCLFAAHAASDPKKFDWRLSVSHVDAAQIATIASEAISDPHISTQSIIFPSVVETEDLLGLLYNPERSGTFLTWDARAVQAHDVSWYSR